ncbi:MAG: hypothetical protein CME88_01295 [Hirschia sp.]|nr:hypothetical protein [Hirschia sp.]
MLLSCFASAHASDADPNRHVIVMDQTVDRLWAVNVMIDGQGPFRMIVDTAAAISSVRDTVPAQLGHMAQADQYMVHGLLGVEAAPAFTATTHAGGLSSNGPLLVLNDRDAIRDPSVDGLIGLDLLTSQVSDRRYLMLDFNRGLIETSDDLRDLKLPRNMKWTRQTKTGRDLGFLSIPITIEGRKAIGLIDTGINFAVANEALGTALKKRGSQISTTPFVDVNGEERMLKSARVGTIRGARMVWAGSTIMIHDAPAVRKLVDADQPVLLIGLQHLRKMVVVVDRAQHKLAIGADREMYTRESCTGSRIACNSGMKSIITKN